MDKHLKELRASAKVLDPVLQIGKNGLTDGSIDLIDRELEAKQLIKIKLHKSALSLETARSDRAAIAQEIAARTRSQIVEQVGNVIVLYRS